ncbi:MULTISPECIES: hypothetical protein [Amycolatopsis]|uniref:hypothetical protein n=1 Tax=Amycolatopsis TaxID=1813 RepID=UPI001E381E9D|nr:hypothetical protein [Amycolatopsis bullii]
MALSRSALASTGAAVGTTAAAPTVALALSAGEAFSSLELSTLFVLRVAEVHGVRLDEIERRRTLVMGILLGQSGSSIIVGKIAERTGQHWARQLARVAPFGIVAAVGGGANAAVAALAVRAARRAFGPAPQSWPETALP